MKSLLVSCFLLICGGVYAAEKYVPSLKDEYEWLVPLSEKRATEWVEKHNDLTRKTYFEAPTFEVFKKEILETLSADDTFKAGDIRGDYFYNVDKSKSRKLGAWQRIPFSAFTKKDFSKWEELLDLDALSAKEGKTWVLHRSTCLAPEYKRCLLFLSLGGADIGELREFDLPTKQFVKDGFNYPLAQTQAQWLDLNKILIASDFGAGTTINSGNAKQVRAWKRGQPRDPLPVAYECTGANTTGVYLDNAEELPSEITIAAEYVGFREAVFYLLKGDRFSIRLDLPLDSRIQAVHRGMGLITLMSDWSSQGEMFKAGSIITLDLLSIAKGGKASPKLLYAPAKKEVIQNVESTRNFVWVTLLSDVESRILRFENNKGKWKSGRIVRLPEKGSVEWLGLAEGSDRMLAIYQNYVTPETLYAFDKGELKPHRFHQSNPDFDPKNLKVERFWTKSKDGTDVPYFVVRPKNKPLDGTLPTIMWGYGAGNVSYSPFYLTSIGKVWLARGGAYVHAIVRGGGELGPSWRKGGYQKTKPNTFADFIAIAEDLQRRKITSPKHLGTVGGSWGGLLVAASMIQRPELFGAVMPEVPMTDMLNYTLFRSAWSGEFGDPADPEYTEILRSYSPYHILNKEAKYPPLLVTSATNDDRMHPAHARRFVAKLLDQGHGQKNALNYFEVGSGGHGASTSNEDSARQRALRYVFFAKHLGLKP